MRNVVSMMLCGTACAIWVCGLTGCTGHQLEPPAEIASSEAVGAGPIGSDEWSLPSPQSILAQYNSQRETPVRQSRYVAADLEKLGNEYDPALPNHNAYLLGDDLGLNSWKPAAECTLVDTAYACFHFEISGYDGSSMLRFKWTDAPMQSDWWFVALANWDDNRWDWYVGNDDSRIEPASLAPYLTIGGDLVAAVLCTGYLDGLLDKVYVGGTPPLAAISASKTIGAIPFDVRYYGTSSLAVEGELTNFEWDLDDDGIYETNTGTTKYVDYTFVSNGEHDVHLRVTNTSGATDTDYIRVQAIGDWGRTWGLDSDDVVSGILATSDGSIFATGYTRRSGGTGDTSLLLLRVSPAGILVWAKTWDTGESEYGNCILQEASGDLIVAGSYRYNDSSDVLVQRWTRSGQLVWSHGYGGTHPDEARALCEDNNVVYVAGDTVGADSTTADVFLMKLDPNGTHFWGYCRDHGNVESIEDMCRLEDDAGQIQGVIMIGTSQPLGLEEDPFGIKLEYFTDGSLRSERELVGPSLAAIPKSIAYRGGSSVAEERYYTGVELIDTSIFNKTDMCMLIHDGYGDTLLGNHWITDAKFTVGGIYVPDASTVLLCGNGYATTMSGLLWQFNAYTGVLQHAYTWDANCRLMAIAPAKYGILLAGSTTESGGTWDEWSASSSAVALDWVNSTGTERNLAWAWDRDAVGNLGNITTGLLANQDSEAGGEDLIVLHRLWE